MAKTSWLFVVFGEHQMAACRIVRRALISPLIYKDFLTHTLSLLAAILLP